MREQTTITYTGAGRAAAGPQQAGPYAVPWRLSLVASSRAGQSHRLAAVALMLGRVRLCMT